MITEELVEFIKRQKNIGVSRGTIEKILAPHGWVTADVDEAMLAIDNEAREMAAVVGGGVSTPAPLPVPQDVSPAQPSMPPITFGKNNTAQSSGSAVDFVDDVSGDVAEISQPAPLSALSPEPVSIPTAVPETGNTVATEAETGTGGAAPVGPRPTVDINEVLKRNAQAAIGAIDNGGLQTPAPPRQINPLPEMAPPVQAAPINTPLQGQVPPAASPATIPSAGTTYAPPATSPVIGSQVATPPASGGIMQAPAASVPPVTPAGAPLNQGGMQTITPTDLKERNPKKRHTGIAVIVVILLLLVGAAALQLFGVISIPGMPTIVGAEKGAVQKATAFVKGESLGAVDFQTTVQIAHESDSAQSIQGTITGRHEFFSPDQQSAMYTFQFSRSNISAAGDIRLSDETLWLRLTEASPDVQLLGLSMQDYLGTWFQFDRGLLMADGYLLFDPSHIAGPNTPAGSDQSPSSILSRGLLEIESASISKAEVGQLSDGEVAANIEVSASWTQDIVRDILRSVDRWLGGYADNQDLVAILDTLRSDPVVLLVDRESGEPKVLSIPIRAQAADFGTMSGTIETRFDSFNQTVDIVVPGTSVVSFDEFLTTRQQGSTNNAIIDGTQLLRRTLQDARITNVIDVLSFASRSAREQFEVTSSYISTCSADTTQTSFASLAETFPSVSPECMANEESFVIFTAFDGGYVCADSERFVGLLDEVPTGDACVSIEVSEAAPAIGDLENVL